MVRKILAGGCNCNSSTHMCSVWFSHVACNVKLSKLLYVALEDGKAQLQNTEELEHTKSSYQFTAMVMMMLEHTECNT